MRGPAPLVSPRWILAVRRWFSVRPARCPARRAAPRVMVDSSAIRAVPGARRAGILVMGDALAFDGMPCVAFAIVEAGEGHQVDAVTIHADDHGWPVNADALGLAVEDEMHAAAEGWRGDLRRFCFRRGGCRVGRVGLRCVGLWCRHI